MMMFRRLLTMIQRLRCRLHACPGHVVSGIHNNQVWIGWQCDLCGKVKHYEPTWF
jgi:hypothetical protein